MTQYTFIAHECECNRAGRRLDYMALAAPLAVTMDVLRDCAVGWGARRKGVLGGGEVVTLVVSGLGSLSLSCEKDAPVGDRRCGCNSCCI